MFKRSGVWWACIRYKGRKIQRSLETSDKKLAKAIEGKIKIQLVEHKYIDKPVGEDKKVSNMIEKFMLEHAPKVSINMQKSYKASKNHLIPFFGESSLLSVSSKEISRYKMKRRDGKAKPATINRELAMLSKAFNLAVKEWEWINENPVSKVSKEEENNERDRWLSEDEEKSLLENCPEWVRDIVVFALNTGMRQDELLSLEWSRVSKIRKTALIQKSKNGKPRTIPLNQTALNVLEKKSKVRNLKCSIVFASNNWSKIDRHNLRRTFKKVLECAVIENFTFHDLRHTFATRIAQKGIDIYKISKLLGHKDIRMTQRYAHHCPESLRDGVDILDSDYNMTTVEEKRIVEFL